MEKLIIQFEKRNQVVYLDNYIPSPSFNPEPKRKNEKIHINYNYYVRQNFISTLKKLSFYKEDISHNDQVFLDGVYCPVSTYL